MISGDDQILRGFVDQGAPGEALPLVTGEELIIARLIPRRLIDFLDTTDQHESDKPFIRSFE